MTFSVVSIPKIPSPGGFSVYDGYRTKTRIMNYAFMKKKNARLFWRILAGVAALLLFASCSEKDWINSGPDSFEGHFTDITLAEECAGLAEGNLDMAILAEDGTMISRAAVHRRSGSLSLIRLGTGLKEGVYRLLYATHRVDDAEEQAEYGFGSRICVSETGIRVIDSFNPTLRLAGEGTSDDPFIISSSSHLFNLMMAVNDYDTNRLITKDTYFMQVCDVDMKSMSRSCDSHYGWMPVGADTNTPFRGVFMGEGHAVKNLIISRPSTPGVGLFGFVTDAVIDGIEMRGASIEGQYAVGSIVGAVIDSGDNARGSVAVTNCSVTQSTVGGNSTSAMVGGIIGAVDMHSKALLANCSSTGGSVTGNLNVGGLLGGAALYSSVMLSACTNNTPVTGLGSGTGGLVGTADTLQVVGCRNYERITGPVSTPEDNPGIGTGGIAGGSGYSWLTGCENHGVVSGYEGVGGIIGSTRVRGSDSEAFIYNQSVLRYCTNTGDVSGSRFAGGAIGEAQAGAFSVCNSGAVKAARYAGGICGAASLAVIHNSVNEGQVNADTRTGGIIGKCTWGSVAVCHNTGSISASSGDVGGIAGLAGNNTVIHYCGNFGNIDTSSGNAGGIVGSIGEPRHWSGLDIAECVVGTLECVMAIAGPSLAFIEGAVEMAEAVEITIKLVETSMEAALQVTDYVLLGFGLDEIINPETEAELKAIGDEAAKEAEDTNAARIAAVRSRCKGNISNFHDVDLTTSAMVNVDRLMQWYSMEGNDEKFNEAINEKREERAGQLEEIAHTKEIVHTVIAGVAVVVSTVALVAGEIASGGTATAFVCAGAVAAVVGGVNAIVKSCTNFEKNAVIISQCINAQTVSSRSGKAASIAGSLCDASIIDNCLSTLASKDNQSEDFAGDIGSYCKITHCISLVPHPGTSHSTALFQCVYADPALSGGTTAGDADITVVAPTAMSGTKLFENLGFSIGPDGIWSLDASLFPVPCRSEMQE